MAMLLLLSLLRSQRRNSLESGETRYAIGTFGLEAIRGRGILMTSLAAKAGDGMRMAAVAVLDGCG